MTIMKNKLRIIDNGPIQTIYADEIASVELIGSNVKIVFAELVTIETETVLAPVINLVRPLASCLQLTLQDLLRPQIDNAPIALPAFAGVRH
jgi:hypothetical protein